MTQPAGRNVRLTASRRFMCDVVHFARQVPSVPMQRRMRLASVMAARAAALPRPGWCALFLKAYSFVAAARHELRRAYLPRPWPHLYEHPVSIGSIAVERELDDEE